MNHAKKAALKRLLVHIRMWVLGVAVTLGCGGLMLTDSSFNGKKEVRTVPTAGYAMAVQESTTQEEEVSLQEQIDESAARALRLLRGVAAAPVRLPVKMELSFVEFKKAPLSEYDMSVVQTSAKTVKIGANGITDPNDFTVPFPEQDTLIYLPVRREPMELTDTRSVADEYYRIYDENSGSYYTMNAHELLCLMVNNEIGDSWDQEAIKAQIVAAYSHLRFNHEHGLTPTVGLRYGYSSKLEGCVNAVEGQAMLYDGQVINGVYSASSAGYSTTAKDIWNVDYPYLKCVESEVDKQAPNFGEERSFSKEQVRAMLEGRFGITLSDDVTQWFTITRAYSVVYIDTVMIDGRDSCTLTGIQLCNMMDLMSNAIDIKYKDGTFTFISYGWGHGVGMSQWGAKYLADDGWTYDQILTHYYVDAYLEVTSPCTSAMTGEEESEPEDGPQDNDEYITTEPPAVYSEPVTQETYYEPTVTTAPVTEYPAYTDTESYYGDWSEYYNDYTQY